MSAGDYFIGLKMSGSQRPCQNLLKYQVVVIQTDLMLDHSGLRLGPIRDKIDLLKLLVWNLKKTKPVLSSFSPNNRTDNESNVIQILGVGFQGTGP